MHGAIFREGIHMGQAIELLTGNATAPGTTFTSLTMATGNSNTIRSANLNSPVGLLGAWAFNNGAGAFRIRSPRLHDNVQGIRMIVDALDPSVRYPRYQFMQPLIPQDVLTLEITGSATAGKIECASLLVYYGDLPGVNARFITTAQLKKWGLNMMGQQTNITAGSAGGYSGQVAVNSLANANNWKANTDYALMGYICDTACDAVRIQGADVGNLGIGGPGRASDPNMTAYWFCWLSDYYGIAMVPVFNAANVNAILVDVAQNDGGAAVNITFFFVELMAPSLRT
jgi:hypothetical protein